MSVLTPAARDDFALLRIATCVTEHIAHLRWTHNLRAHPANRVMYWLRGIPHLAIHPDLPDSLLAHEMGHALVWDAAGRPYGSDWASGPGGALAGAERAATRAGIAYGELRGLDTTGQQMGEKPDDIARGLVTAAFDQPLGAKEER